MKPASIRLRTLALGIGLGVTLCACYTTHSAAADAAPSYAPEEHWTTPKQADPQGDDLKIPDAPSSNALGKVRRVDEPLRPIEGMPTGRVWLLEMYQTAVAEKDELTRRAADLVHERDAALARAAELEKARADLEARHAALATEMRDLQTKSLELARRLAEAELARLQAEKTTLDSRPSARGAEKP
jgi:hypothetical protein